MRIPLWRRKQKEELEEELRGHLEAAVRERMERGESRADAEAAARREFGNVNVVRETTRDMWGWASLDQLAQDVRYALRTMAARPGFSAVAILSLALGIGANTAIFSLWNGLLHSALPGVRNPEELVILSNPDDTGSWTGRWDGDDGPRSWLTWSEFEDLRDRADRFAELMASQSSLSNWRVRVEGGEFEEARGRMVSGAFFDVLGVRPAIGSVFSLADDHRETHTAVISYNYWQRRFGGRVDVLGKSIGVGKAALTITGVTPAGFIGETMAQHPDLWITLRMQPLVQTDRNRLRDTPPNKSMWLHVFGRLKHGVTLAQAEAQANSVLQANLESFYGPAALGQSRAELLNQRLRLGRAAKGASSKRWALSGLLNALLAAVGVLLLTACANLANLLLARSAARKGEVALRLSLGASRSRLIRQLITESVTLTALGGVTAIVVAYFAHDALVRMIASSDSRFQMSFSLDPLVLAFLTGVTAVAALLFGVLPALQMMKTDVAGVLREHNRGAVGSAGQLRSSRLLVSLQLALSLPLLVGAGLLARTVYNLQRIDVGFTAERLVLARVDLNETEAARRGTLVRELLAQLQQISGVRGASYSHLGVMSGGESSEAIAVEGYTPKGENNHSAKLDVVGPGYFATLSIPLLRGREIQERDAGPANPVCVVNEAFVERFFAGRDPIGKGITTIEDDGVRTTYAIVGVAKNAKTHGLRDTVLPRFFIAAMQPALRTTRPTFLIRTATDAAPLITTVRKTVERVDPAVPILSAHTAERHVAGITANERATAQLAVVFGGVALTLAAIGLYGVLSYGVTRRTGEIAIRIALGAPPGRVISMILGETIALVSAGLALGGGLAYGAARLIDSQLYGVAPQDPLTLALATGLLLLVALSAAYVPAQRAANVDPMVALRHE